MRRARREGSRRHVARTVAASLAPDPQAPDAIDGSTGPSNPVDASMGPADYHQMDDDGS